MKRLTFIWGILAGLSAMTQGPVQPSSQNNGYEIKVNFKPFKNQYIYLGHYFGKQYPIIDSAKLDANSQAVFKGNIKLPGGIYLVGYPNKAGFFEILIDKEQHFSVLADTATLKKGLNFRNSSDNVLFNAYQRFMSEKGKKIQEARQHLNSSRTSVDSAKWSNVLTETDREVRTYREDFIKNHPSNILTALLLAMREPEIPAQWKSPKNREDSLKAYYYFKNHFWDGVNFWDGRLAYTTFFEEKLDKYINELMVPDPDSVIREIDGMMAYAGINDEMNRFLLLKFLNRYLNQKYMWEDKVFVHLFEKYFAQKNYSWLTEYGRKTITDRAYSLMANLMGTAASDIELPDTSGVIKALYALPAEYTVVAFWDPTCGHCKEVIPRLDSLYRDKWRHSGVKIFSVAKETDGSRNDWLKFVRDYKLQDWTNVYYSKAEEKIRIEANIPGYSQLYDVQTFPTLYLLDKDKRIIAKKLDWKQIDEVLQIKMKRQ